MQDGATMEVNGAHPTKVQAVTTQRSAIANVVCIALALALAACSPVDKPATIAACELRVAWDPYEPYSYSAADGRPIGYDIDVVKRVANEIDCTVTFTEMAWSDILIALQNGSVDVTVGTGFKQARSDWSWYSESYRDELIGLLMRSGDAGRFPGNSIEELLRGGMLFGKTTDDTYDSAKEAVFKKYGEQVLARVSEAENLDRLLDKSIDSYLIEVNVAAAMINNKDMADRVEFHPLVFPDGAYRLQMSKKTISADRVAEINAAIQRLLQSGWLSEALEAYSIQ